MRNLKGKSRFLAFTLAETLVVIGIIGVISALTLPNLSQSTGNLELVTKLKKEHQVLSESYSRARVKYGTSLASWYQAGDTTDAARSTRVARRLMEFLNIEKDCGLTANSACFSTSNVVSINGGSGSNFLSSNTSYYRFQTRDNSSYAVRCISSGSGWARGGRCTLNGFSQICQVSLANAYPAGCYVYVDIDGPSKGTNTYGKDIFEFTISDQSSKIATVDFATTTLQAFSFGSDTGCKGGYPMVCSAWILEAGNANYPSQGGVADIMTKYAGSASISKENIINNKMEMFIK